MVHSSGQASALASVQFCSQCPAKASSSKGSCACGSDYCHVKLPSYLSPTLLTAGKVFDKTKIKQFFEKFRRNPDVCNLSTYKTLREPGVPSTGTSPSRSDIPRCQQQGIRVQRKRFGRSEKHSRRVQHFWRALQQCAITAITPPLGGHLGHCSVSH